MNCNVGPTCLARASIACTCETNWLLYCSFLPRRREKALRSVQRSVARRTSALLQEPGEAPSAEALRSHSCSSCQRSEAPRGVARRTSALQEPRGKSAPELDVLELVLGRVAVRRALLAHRRGLIAPAVPAQCGSHVSQAGLLPTAQPATNQPQEQMPQAGLFPIASN